MSRIKTNYDDHDLSKLTDEELSLLLLAEQDLKLVITENMMKYGGSFVKALSHCIIFADSKNLLKLVKSFREYFIEYQPSAWLPKEVKR